MKIRSLLLGSVAAAGLSTGAYAADLGVLTSLDVCDALGLSGLTISSDTNCLQITGAITYEFQWGDFEGDSTDAWHAGLSGSGPTTPGTDHWVTLSATNDTVAATPGGYGNKTIPTAGSDTTGPGAADRNLDWYSKMEAWIRFVATADSDFGPARAVIKIKDLQEYKVINEHAIAGKVSPFGPYVAGGNGIWEAGADPVPGTGGDHTFGPIFDEAYVAVGDTTMIMAGKKGTIMNFADDVPLNHLGLFHSEKVDHGVKWTKDRIGDGGHVLQVVSDLGNGVSVAAGLEKLDALQYHDGQRSGTAAGVIAYAGDGISAHLTVAAAGFLDGTVDAWGIHAGVAGSFDIVKFVAAVAADDTGFWNALGSASATFDMFTIAVAGEAVADIGSGLVDYGAGASIGAAVTDGVSINLGSRFYHDADDNNDGTGVAVNSYQVEAQLVAAVTETITLTGSVGAYGNDGGLGNVYYGAAQAAWAPGGGFTSSIKGEVYSNGAYKATVKAAKTFE